MDNVASLGVRAVAQLIIRAVATRGITLLGTIALARILTPADFGVFALITFIVVLLGLVGDIGIGGALIQQSHVPTDRELSTAFTFQVAIWTLVLVIVWIVAAVLPALMPDVGVDVQGLARLLGIATWLNGLRAVPTVMLTRVLRFGPLAVIEVAQQTVYFALAVALAAAGWGVLSFGIAAVAQGLLATVAIWVAFRRWPGFGFDSAAARRMWGFGLSYQLSLVLYWARDSVVALFGGLAGGLQGIGFIQFAWRNGQFAVSVEEIVARVAFPAFSRLQAQPERLGPIVGAAIEAGFLAIAIIQGWLAATAPTLVPTVFSVQWIPAIHVFQLICIGSLAWGPVLILRALVYAGGDSRRGLRLAALTAAVLFLSFPPLVAILGVNGAGISYAGSAVVALLAYVRATQGTVIFPWRSIGRITVETAIASAVATMVVGSIGGPVGLVLSGLAYVAAFSVLIVGFERSLVRRAISVVRRSGTPLESGGPAPTTDVHGRPPSRSVGP